MLSRAFRHSEYAKGSTGSGFSAGWSSRSNSSRRLVPQPRQDPSLGDEHADLDLGLVAGVPGACGQDRGPVVLRQLLVRALDPRLVPTGDDDAALQLVRDERGRDAAEEPERADVARDEVGAALRQRRLGEGVVRRAEHRDEELDRDRLAGLRIDDVRLLPGVVDEELLAGSVLLPYREVALVEPLAVPLAELRVAVAVRMLLQVLEVQQFERHARLPALDMDVRAVRHRPITGGGDRGVELRLQRVVPERLQRGPVEPGRDRSRDRPRD